jgi:hypothetical protein
LANISFNKIFADFRIMDNRLNYFKKMKESTKSPPAVSLVEIFWSWIGAMAGIAPVVYINYNLLEGTDFVMVIGSFGGFCRPYIRSH